MSIIAAATVNLHLLHDAGNMYIHSQVNLGVVEENTSSISGVANVMRHLHKYVPRGENGLHVIPCHGDGLSVERMGDAMKHNASADTPLTRLQGVVPVPQEFHKSMILLKVNIVSTNSLVYTWFCTTGCCAVMHYV